MDTAARTADARRNADLSVAKEVLKAPRKFGAATTEVTREKATLRPQREKMDAKKDKRPHCNKRPDRTKGGGGGSKGFRPWC